MVHQPVFVFIRLENDQIRPLPGKNKHMSGLMNVHFLKISGMIGPERRKEFVNTVRFACALFSPECIGKNLSAGLLTEDEYYFFASWSSERALRKFMGSEEFFLIRGAYDAMGVLEKIEIGYNVEIKSIQIHPS